MYGHGVVLTPRGRERHDRSCLPENCGHVATCRSITSCFTGPIEPRTQSDSYLMGSLSRLRLQVSLLLPGRCAVQLLSPLPPPSNTGDTSPTAPILPHSGRVVCTWTNSLQELVGRPESSLGREGTIGYGVFREPNEGAELHSQGKPGLRVSGGRTIGQMIEVFHSYVIERRFDRNSVPDRIIITEASRAFSLLLRFGKMNRKKNKSGTVFW